MMVVDCIAKEYQEGEVKTRALSDVSFQVSEGEFVAIMGPSGSGKSTLLHILGFLDRLTTGEYRFFEKSFDDYTEYQRAKIRNEKMGFVFQTFNLLPRATVLENVRLPFLYSTVSESEWDDRARDVIEHVGLSHRILYDVSQLSGGEKQRVAIARALVNKPSVIFADEPTGNLDSASGQVVMQTLQRLHADGHTIFLITHELYTAEHAERVISIRDGRVVRDEKVTNRRHAKDGFHK
ncbi:macrolide ABC transporter ATP-binding protein [Candidatus Giovannonibacteria bacterium RIFCSPHIGHO2_02_FULL_46_20]|uniref:Macrolide ABC transporter ATP-binding protein n=1 Tax=Candidatus Giovannonibacteria bacterium RIFCSPHIGHO2_02_FULL_46_20 TaxID=1798338 RepID=A0A1F5WFS6_9BACT|nr:MAG: macrolide ABC transporter ATP-binding protein [Candidatus Giovannonibacteria bacterium RIFCSPHIGHO2_02_FULL_46_20]